MGTFFGGKFYLTVSLPWDETTEPEKVAFIQTLFEKVSEYLFAATNKTHSIGGILYSPKFVAANSDIEIHAGGAALPDSMGARLWAGSRVDVYEDSLHDVSLLVHELGHYLYGLGDETLNGNVWSCVTNSASGSCLMELYNDADHVRWRDKSPSLSQYYLDLDAYLSDKAANNATFEPAGLTFFCWGNKNTPHGDHDPDTLTPQNNDHGKRSCWEVMADDASHDNIPYDLHYPAAGPSTTLVPAPDALPPIEPLIPVERIALLIDRSASMLGPKFEGAKVGAEAVIDLLKPKQQALLASFGSHPTVSAPMDVVPDGAGSAWRTNLKYLLGVLTPSGTTAIGPGLDLARTAIAGVDIAASQSILLLSDGRENVFNPSVEQAIPDLVADNVRVYPIGFGSDQDDVLLKSLAEKTGGEYLPLAPNLSTSEIQAAIPEVMTYLAGAIAQKSMVTALYDVDASFAGDVDVTPFRWGNFPAPASIVRGNPPAEIVLPVHISPVCSGCTIGCSWDAAGKRFDVDVFRPGETEPYTERAGRRIRGTRNYSYFSMARPPGGTWKLRIRGTDIQGTRFKIYGFQVHPKLRMETHVRRGIVSPGAEVEITAHLRVPEPVVGATVRAWVFKPDDSWERVQLVEGTGAAAGTYSAKVSSLSGVDGSYLVCIDAELGVHPPNLKMPAFKLRKLTSFVADASGRFVGKPLFGTNFKPPRIPLNQRNRFDEWIEKNKRR
jgi:hypothetical protein